MQTSLLPNPKIFRHFIALIVMSVVLLGYPNETRAFHILPTSKVKPPVPSVPFIQNVGQWQEEALFQSQWEGATLFLAKDALWLSYLDAPDIEYERFNPTTGATTDSLLRGGIHLRLSFIGANPHPIIEPFAPLTTSVNYFRGDDPLQWKTQVPVWGGVRYQELYPGVDLELTGVNGKTTPRLVIQDSTRANLAQIRLQVEGSEFVKLHEEQLVAHTKRGNYPIPLFQLTGIESALAETKPTVTTNVVHTPFVPKSVVEPSIPPSTMLPSNLLYSTFLGGTDLDQTDRITRDQLGAIYVGGMTESFDFPTTPGTFDSTPEPSEYRRQAFITKLNPAGTDLEYSTFIDGNNSDYVDGLAVDNNGAVYVAGETWSSNFPTTSNSPFPNNPPEVDGYALKLSATGAELIYSTYLGGNNIDYARDIALGPDGSVTVLGRTASPDFPVTPQAYDTSQIHFDIFVTRISADGSTLIYSTFLGGTYAEYAFSVVVNSNNNAYILGRTDSSDYPTTPGAFDPTPTSTNLVVTQLTPQGDDLVYSTALGGRAGTWAGAIAIDAVGATYITTEAERTGFPVTPGAYDTTCGIFENSCDGQGHSDGVLIKLNATGSDVIYGTYFGGGLNEWGHEVQIDPIGNAYIIGRSDSADFPVTPGSYTVASPNLSPFIIAKFNSTGTALLHLTRTPGAIGAAFFLESEDVLWLSGGVSPDYYTFETTPGAYDTTFNGGLADAGIARLVLPKASTVTTIESTGGVALSTEDTFTATTTFAADPFTATAIFTHAPRHPLSMPPIAPAVHIVGDPFVHYATIDNTVVAPLHPYTLTLQTDPSITAPLLLYVWDGSAWHPDSTATYDPATRTLTASRTTFGWYFLAQTEPVPDPTPCPTTTPTPGPTVTSTLPPTPTSTPIPTTTPTSTLHKLFLPLICK